MKKIIKILSITLILLSLQTEGAFLRKLRRSLQEASPSEREDVAELLGIRPRPEIGPEQRRATAIGRLRRIHEAARRRPRLELEEFPPLPETPTAPVGRPPSPIRFAAPVPAPPAPPLPLKVGRPPAPPGVRVVQPPAPAKPYDPYDY